MDAVFETLQVAVYTQEFGQIQMHGTTDMNHSSFAYKFTYAEFSEVSSIQTG